MRGGTDEGGKHVDRCGGVDGTMQKKRWSIWTNEHIDLNHVIKSLYFKDRNKSRDRRLLISANHEIISTGNFAALPLHNEASVSDNLGLVGRRPSSTFTL